MADPPKTSQLGHGILGGLVLGYGPAPIAPPSGPANALVTQEVVEVVLGLSPGVRVTQEVLEVVLGQQVNTRVTQEVVEVVLGLSPNVRATQEVLEVVLDTAAPPASEWVVRTHPVVRWTGEATDDPAHPRGAWVVRCHPKVLWDAEVIDPTNRWIVHTAPRVIWGDKVGVVDTDCLSGDGVVPPSEPVVDNDRNYVF